MANYEDESVVKKIAKGTWHEIPAYPIRLTNGVVFSELNREDSLIMSLTGITSEEDELFSVK